MVLFQFYFSSISNSQYCLLGCTHAYLTYHLREPGDFTKNSELDLAELTVYDLVGLLHNHTVKLQSKKHVALSLRLFGTTAHNILHVRVQILPINSFAAKFVRFRIAVSEKQIRQWTMASCMFIVVTTEF